MNIDLIQYIAKKANVLGLRGVEVVAWIPPTCATQDWTGIFVIKILGANDNVGNKEKKWADPF
jgi:hypothetical protein